MAFSESFVASQLLGIPDTIVLTDTSTGSDGDIAERRVYIKDAYNNDVLPEGNTDGYVTWDLEDSSINIECLDKDMAVQITVDWVDAEGETLYEAVSLYGFTAYNEDFDYQLSAQLAANYKRSSDNDFWQNKFLLRTYIDSGDQALQRGGDLASAQACYDLATSIRRNSTYLFNTTG